MTLNDRLGDHGRILIHAYVVAQQIHGTMEQGLCPKKRLMLLAQH
jgi:hypothetical protein